MERSKNGFKIYVESMAKSTDDKTKEILPLVRESLESIKGDILDLGAGTGNLSLTLLDLTQEKSGAGLTIVDMDVRMIKILENKFGSHPKVSLILCDVLNLNLDKHFSVVICSSLLHEIFSSKGSINDVKKTLERIRYHLLPKGTLIIRDGIKPRLNRKMVFLKPLRPEINEKLWKFVACYKYLETAPYKTQIDGQEVIAMTSELAYEFAVKYQYPEINWPAEMKEQFGFWTEDGARKILGETGFEVFYLKRYLLDYFKTLFSKDFEFFKCKNGKLVKVAYFDTHMVIAAKRI